MGVDNLVVVVVVGFPGDVQVDSLECFLEAVGKVYVAVLMVEPLVIVGSMVVSGHQESLMAIVVVLGLDAYLPFLVLGVDSVFGYASVGGAYLLVTCDVAVNAYLQEKQCVVVSVHLLVTCYAAVATVVEDMENHDQAFSLGLLDKELDFFVVDVSLGTEENSGQGI